MRRIIYNTKLKKFILGMLVFMILFNFVLPYKVLAANCTADELRMKLYEILYPYTNSTVTANKSQCETIISKITANGGTNDGYIYIDGDTLKIRASEDTIREAFEQVYSTEIVSNMINNVYPISVELTSNGSTSRPETNGGENNTTQPSMGATLNDYMEDLAEARNKDIKDLWEDEDILNPIVTCLNRTSKLRTMSHTDIMTMITSTNMRAFGGFDPYYGDDIEVLYDEESFEVYSAIIRESNEVLAQDFRTIIITNESLSQAFGVPPVLSNCQDAINHILSTDTRNSITSYANSTGKLVIEFTVTSPTTVEEAIGKVIDRSSGVGGNVAANSYAEYGLVVKVEYTYTPDGNLDEDGDGEIDPDEIAEWLLYKYGAEGLTPQQANSLAQSGHCTVETNADRTEIINVTVPMDILADYGLSAGTLSAINQTQNPGASADLGGILLSPVFYLINFIVDAITSNLGSIMYGQGLSAISGFSVLSSTKTPVAAGVTDYYEVDISSFLAGAYQYPNIKYTPEEIFAGKVELLSIDFISGNDFQGNPITGDWTSIRYVVAEWYKVLRMIAIIGLLSVLIYTGIKIIISSNAKDKAKYKEWIINWFIAVAILFLMHYIMSFIISVTGEINKLLNQSCEVINVKLTDGETFATNLMGLVRFMIQSESFMIKVGYEVMYVALLVYTVKFTFVYLKRVLNMAFLTLIAPIVALTYPIDKINDGQAQGFNMWLREYIFNALLQPMHYILYYVLVGSAVGIAASNPIYGIVVLMFMTEAEKLLKKIFGFEKAGQGTVGGLGTAFAAGALASNIKDIARMAKLPGGNAGKGGAEGGDNNNLLNNPRATEPRQDVLSAFGDEDAPDSGGGDGSRGQNLIQANGRDERQIQQQNNRNEEERLASERSVLEEFEEEGALSDNWSDEDYEAYQQLEQEQLEQEERLRQQQNSGNGEERLASERSVLEGFEEEGALSDNWSDEDYEAYQQLEQEQLEQEERLRQQQLQQQPTPQQQIPIRTLANNNRFQNFKKGTKAVAKKMVKPIWDFDKSKKYNGKRLVRNIGKTVGKAALGFSLGTAAAAIQAGISITDGKYSPMEGVATFSAGVIGGSKIVNSAERGINTIADAYREGTLPDDPTARKAEIMRRAQERFGDRDDVIAFNNREYAPAERESRLQRERDNYLTNGYSDLNKMKRGMKYADTLVGDVSNLSAEEQRAARRRADKHSINTMNFIDTLEGQGQTSAIHNKDERENYIATLVEGKTPEEARRIRNSYNNAFRSARAFYEANR